LLTIGLLTEDSRFYHELVSVLRERRFPFVSLTFDGPIPEQVGVIITTAQEADRLAFRPLIADEPQAARAVSRALHLLRGGGMLRSLVVGIDPGRRPGIAALGDGVVLDTLRASSPEAAASQVEELAALYPASEVRVRIGHGDRTNRNRIFNALWDAGYTIEIVDEYNTTHRTERPDIEAAIEIALTPGYAPKRRQLIAPSDGEVRDIQRLSRLRSEGRLTISQGLARDVAAGRLSLDEAIQRAGLPRRRPMRRRGKEK